jgi:hypothetical protein
MLIILIAAVCVVLLLLGLSLLRVAAISDRANPLAMFEPIAGHDPREHEAPSDEAPEQSPPLEPRRRPRRATG